MQLGQDHFACTPKKDLPFVFILTYHAFKTVPSRLWLNVNANKNFKGVSIIILAQLQCVCKSLKQIILLSNPSL